MKKRAVSLSLIVLLFLFSYIAYAKTRIEGGCKIQNGVVFIKYFCIGGATLAWDANTEPDLAGYKLYYDINSGDPYSPAVEYQANEGDSPITITVGSLDDADNPEYTLTELTVGRTYYFALTAYDTEELESDYSNEVYCLIK